MKLIEDLGMQEYGTQGLKRLHGIYECPECGIHFRCITSNVKRGNTTKCKACSIRLIANTKVDQAAKVFIDKAISVHGDTYSYCLVQYVRTHTKVQIICHVHGVFWQIGSDHLQGKGCPGCAKTGFDKTKSAVLYYLKVISDNTVAYKIGITNRTVQERFNNTDLAKIQVLKTWDFPLGADALTKEQDILALHQEYKYLGEPLLSSGNTELFTQDILGLDTSLAQEVL